MADIMRRLIYDAMIEDRRTAFGCLRCDHCRSVTGPFHMHEIIGRNRTIKQPEIRKYTYAKELCSILCGNCHLNRPVTSKLAQEKLFGILYIIYGENRVRQALEKIPPRYLTSIYLPEKGYEANNP